MTTVTAQSPPLPPPPPPRFSSRSTTQTTNASHEFMIEGYSLTKGIGIGKHIASDVFTVGGYQWAIYFYPHGKNPNDKSEFVSVYVTLESEGTNVRALFELKLLDQSGQGKHRVHSHFVPGPRTIKQKGSMWGYKRFFRRALLESSDFLKNDCLKFDCTVGVLISATDCPQLNSIHVPESDIGSHFDAPLKNIEGSDVTIDVASDASDTTEPTIDTSDWRTQIQPDQRQRIVNKIMDTLRKHLPDSGSEGLLELRKMAQRFEDKIYTAATSQSDYLRKITMKMLTMENKSQNTVGNNMPSNEGGPSNNLPDQGQQHPNPFPSQHQLSQTIQNNAAPQPNLPSVSALPQIPIQNISQNSNTQQPGQDSMSNTIGQNFNVQSMFPDSQRQMPGRQQVVLKQQQQQSLSQQQILRQQQLLNYKLPQIEQNLLQPNRLQSSQQSAMQTSSAMQPLMMQSSLSSLQQNQQQILYQQQLMNYNLSQMLQQQHQQQQNILQANQLQSSQQSVMQTSSAMQSLMMQSSLSSLQQQQILYQHQLLKHKLSQMLQQQHQQQLMMIMMMIMMMLMMMVVMMMI